MVWIPTYYGIRPKVLRQFLYLLEKFHEKTGDTGDLLIQHVAYCDIGEIQELLGVSERTAYDYQAFAYRLHMLLEYGEEPPR